ncbi:MAG TPA: peptidoglycan-binding protein [Ktedonobacteraceae bacterium]|nr:peptidoglycan-binding protein [Ktedonobacteraceae bacterium]
MFEKKGLLSGLSGGLVLIIALGLFFGMQISSPHSAGAAASWPTVQQGNTGEKVFSIQLMLQAHGYSLSVDGDFGPQTTSTVRSFQSAHGLGVDGIVGPQTWPALIITTQQGSTGSAVQALQRELNAHGANLTVDGNFGALTATATRNFQSSQGIGVDGIAGPQTWQYLVGTVTAPPPSGSTLWGVDTASTVTSSLLNQVISTYGKPAFIGRYITARTFSPIASSEASFLHGQGISILPIQSDLGGDTTYSTGTSRGNQSVSAARALGIPAGKVIIADVETSSAIDAGWIEGWYDTVTAAGYIVGFYENANTSSSKFSGAFCSAVSANSNIARSILFSAGPITGRTSVSSAPAFAPRILTCSGAAKGQTLAWQYGLAGGSGVNVDTDEIKSSVPLW